MAVPLAFPSNPVKIEGSSKVRMPRSVGLNNDIQPKIMYVREDAKMPRDGSGRISPILNVPGVHEQSDLSYVGLKLFTHIVDKKLATQFLEKYKNGDIKKKKLPPFSKKQNADAFNIFCEVLNLDPKEVQNIDDEIGRAHV